LNGVQSSAHHQKRNGSSYQADTANPVIKPYLKEKLYHQNKVFVYDLRPFRK
jgi:hypothetical protein